MNAVFHLFAMLLIFVLGYLWIKSQNTLKFAQEFINAQYREKYVKMYHLDGLFVRVAGLLEIPIIYNDDDLAKNKEYIPINLSKVASFFLQLKCSV